MKKTAKTKCVSEQPTDNKCNDLPWDFEPFEFEPLVWDFEPFILIGE